MSFCSGDKLIFCLRAVDGHYTLVGECLLRGLMEGQAVEMWRQGRLEGVNSDPQNVNDCRNPVYSTNTPLLRYPRTTRNHEFYFPLSLSHPHHPFLV